MNGTSDPENGKLAIIAGGGQLPGILAGRRAAAGAPYYVLRLKGYAEPSLAEHPGAECGLGELGKAIGLLRGAGCQRVTFAGYVARPQFESLRLDLRGARLLPRLIAAARNGDAALLDVLLDVFRNEGFAIVGAEEAADGLSPSAGELTGIVPSARDLADIEKAIGLLSATGPFDVGQGCVIRDGFVLAVEAAEGTDAMLGRCADIADRLGRSAPAGVLVKLPKSSQSRQVDLPTLGPVTVEGAVRAGLAGIAVRAGAALLLERERTLEAARAAGLFVTVLPPEPAP